MDPKVKAKWLKALRSGKYNQTRWALRDEKGYCCLGVLSDLYLKENKLKWDKGNVMADVYSINGKGGLPPKEVVKWAGIKMSKSGATKSDAFNGLPRMNDTNRKTFIEIAEFIETAL